MTDRIAALADYAHAEDLDELGLAQRLGCSTKTLVSLRLCLRPNPEPAVFRREVDRIASRFEVDVGVLAEIIRLSDATRAMRSEADVEKGGLLMAARDRHEDSEGEKS